MSTACCMLLLLVQIRYLCTHVQYISFPLISREHLSLTLMPARHDGAPISSLFNRCPWIMHLFERMTSLSMRRSLIPDGFFVSIPRHNVFIHSHLIVWSPCLSLPPLHLSEHCFSICLAHIQRIVCLCLAHHFRSLPVPPPSLSASPSCALVSASQPGSHQHNVKLSCFCPQLKAVALLHRPISCFS